MLREESGRGKIGTLQAWREVRHKREPRIGASLQTRDAVSREAIELACEQFNQSASVFQIRKASNVALVRLGGIRHPRLEFLVCCDGGVGGISVGDERFDVIFADVPDPEEILDHRE